MQKIIVTGKNGELSLKISERLKSKGYTVENLSLRNSDWERISFVGVYAIVHVAGVVPKAGIERTDFYEINYKLTERLAKKAKNDRVKHFVYISSMAVYGIVPSLKKNCGVIYSDTPCNPTSDYGKSKLFAEEAIKKLEDNDFNITIIRVPSVYGVGRTEYIKQYEYSFGRLKKIPFAFTDKYKSIINIDNLCELIYLIILYKKYGIICPDDGKISAVNLCSEIMISKKRSKFYGIIVRLLKFSVKVSDYFGAVCYDESLTNIFNGEYRIAGYKAVIHKIYE